MACLIQTPLGVSPRQKQKTKKQDKMKLRSATKTELHENADTYIHLKIYPSCSIKKEPIGILN